MNRPDDTVAVRIRVPRTWPRLVLGIALFVLGAPLLMTTSIINFGVGIALLWAGAVLVGKTEQVVSVENDTLVSRTVAFLFPKVTSRIPMERVRGRSFSVRDFARDRSRSDYRPVLAMRLRLHDENGALIHWVGMALTHSEAVAVQEALNRLLLTAGPGLARPPAGIVDEDWSPLSVYP